MEQKKEVVKARTTLSSIQFFSALNKYIPSLVLQSWMQKQLLKENSGKDSSLPYIQDMETVVLFADISGFTNISEACAALGIRGNEELAFCINKYMEAMVKHLAKFGGDIIKFVGDAMIVMWPRIGKYEEGFKDDHDEKVNIIRKAIQCGFDIQQELNNKKIMEGVTNLSVKIGIGFGKCALLYVGGVFDRSEFFTVGSSLVNALSSEEQATAGGQILVSESAFKHVKNIYYEGDEIINEEGKKFYRVTRVCEGVRGRADAVLLKAQIKLERISGIQKSLMSCVPAAIIPYLEIGFEAFGSETRALTVMFATLGVELSSASTQEGMDKIQKIVTTVQQQVYRMEGSLNKLVMDDKGSTLICIWGLCPMAHTDDAQRAILTAFNLRKALKKVDKTWCNVGIASGDVFSGVVGTSGSRKEFSVLGDVVNLAARIMFWPKKLKQKGKINCDLRTMNEAMSQISFKYGGHCEFKGKSISIPIFEPIDPAYEYIIEKGKTIAPQSYLKLCYNPLIVQREVNHKKYTRKYVDKLGFVNEMVKEIKTFFQCEEQIQPLNIIISGENGSGKTHAARSLVEKLQKDQTLQHATQQLSLINTRINNSHSMHVTQKLPIFASSINAESRMKFLGAWRPILRNMFEYKRKWLDISQAEYLKRIINTQYEKLDLILDIFGLEDDVKNEIIDGKKVPNQVVCNQAFSPIHFLLREKYSNMTTDSVIELMLNFIKDFIGDDFENSDDSRSVSQISKMKRDTSKCICVLIFDNASLMDEESWSLILRIHVNCFNICTVLLVDQDKKGNTIMPKLDILQKKIQQDKKSSIVVNDDDIPYDLEDELLVKDFMNSAKIYDVPHLSSRDLKRVLLDLAEQYNETFMDEVISTTTMAEIKDDARKNAQVQAKAKEWYSILKAKYNLQRIFEKVDESILEVVVSRCEGNALICLQFFLNLLSNGFIEINRAKVVVPSEALKKCCRLQNFTKIPVPPCVLKNRLANLDHFLKKGRFGNTKKKELAIKCIMLLKSAAIIGDEFGTLALRTILPLRNETQGSILVILKELELNEFIEILDESDPKDILCRFNQYYLRESIYQVMLFKDQKQSLHQNLAKHLQGLPSPTMDQESIDIELEKLKDHIMIGQDVKYEEDLPFQQLQGIIIKQMQQMLIKSSKQILHKGTVLKQGHSANKKVSKRLLILNAKDVQWFHNIEEYQNNFPALGLIKMEHIYSCYESVFSQQSFDFDICVSCFTKNGQMIDQPNKFSFGCETEVERHHWISRIEFLRTKITYENYVSKFVQIQFPLRKHEDVVDDSEQMKDIIYDQLNQFGKNFKQNVRVNHNVQNQKSKNNLMLKKQRTQQSQQFQQKRGPSVVAGDDSGSESNFLKQINIQTAQELAMNLKQLYNASILAFVNQATINGNKSQNIALKNKAIGQVLPDYFKPSKINSDQSLNSTRQLDKKEKSYSKAIENFKRRKSLTSSKDQSAQNLEKIHQIQEQTESSTESEHLQLNQFKTENSKRNTKERFSAGIESEQIVKVIQRDRSQDLKTKSGEKTAGSLDEAKQVSIQLKKLEEQQNTRDGRFTFYKAEKKDMSTSPKHHLPQEPENSNDTLRDIVGVKHHPKEFDPYQVQILNRSPYQSGILNQFNNSGNSGNPESIASFDSQRYDLMNQQRDVSPVIKDEITRQINQGLKAFFINLDQKLEQKNNNNSVNMTEIFDHSQLLNTTVRKPGQHTHIRSLKGSNIFSKQYIDDEPIQSPEAIRSRRKSSRKRRN